MDSILTVTAAAESFDLVTSEDVQLELGYATSEQAWIDAKITRASAAVATHCKRVFAKQTYSELFRPDRSVEALVLAEYPVRSVTSVTVDGTALETTDYEVDPASAMVYRLCGDARICWYGCKITVAYIAGYVLPDTVPDEDEETDDVPDLPQDIQDAMILLMSSARAAKGRDPTLKSEDIPGVRSSSWWIGGVGDDTAAFPPEVAALLAPHVRPVMA